MNLKPQQTATMKKIIMIMAAAALLTGCNGNKNGNATSAATGSTAVADSSATTTGAADSSVYGGMVPAADCEGIRYRIAVDSSKKNFTMKEDYMETATKVKETFYEKGTVAPYEKAGKKALKLTTKGNDSYYLLTVNDSTLRMVNEDLEAGTAGNYDLKLAK